MHRAVIATAAATVLAVGLTACRGPEPREPDPGPAPTATSATPSPSATAPTMPAQARKNTPEGAVAFVSYWLNVSDFAAMSGDVEQLDEISDRRCRGCGRYISLYQDTYARGGYFRGGKSSVGKLTVDALGRNEFVVATQVRLSPSRFKRSSRAPLERSPASTSSVEFKVIYRMGRPTMREVGLP